MKTIPKPREAVPDVVICEEPELMDAIINELFPGWTWDARVEVPGTHRSQLVSGLDSVPVYARTTFDARVAAEGQIVVATRFDLSYAAQTKMLIVASKYRPAGEFAATFTGYAVWRNASGEIIRHVMTETRTAAARARKS